jgi:anti-sigma factor RsiW
MARTLTCRELIEFLAAYIEEELSAEERARFDLHLAVCPHCVDYLHGYRESIRLGKAALAAEGPIPDEVPAELLDAILASRTRAWRP